MAAHFPDDNTVRTALALAGRAPSVHNSQPWHWRVGPRSMHLYADLAMHLPHADPNKRDLMVSCGAALHHCTVGLAALGWRAVIHRFPNLAQPDHLASLELRREPPDEVDVVLAAAIPRRRTDRRHFSPWPVAFGDVALMGTRAARFGATMRRVETTAEFRAILSDAVWAHMSDDEYLGELMAWSGRHGSVVGVPARNVPDSDPTAAVPGRIFAAAELAQAAASVSAAGNGIMVALGTVEDDDVARLRAGEATSAVLLTATAKGLASCALSEALEVEDTRNRLRDIVFDHCGVPQMLIRVGWPPVNADPLPATPRRPLTAVVSRLDGSAFI